MIRTYEDLIAFNKSNLDAATSAGQALSKGLEDLSKEALAYQSRSLDQAVSVGKQAQSCKTAADVANLQAKLVKDSWDSAVKQSKTMVDLSNAILKSAMEPLQARTRAVMEVAARA